eukprot:6772569-Alexandrium_andersonii.AAC.1
MRGLLFGVRGAPSRVPGPCRAYMLASFKTYAIGLVRRCLQKPAVRAESPLLVSGLVMAQSADSVGCFVAGPWCGPPPIALRAEVLKLVDWPASSGICRLWIFACSAAARGGSAPAPLTTAQLPWAPPLRPFKTANTLVDVRC